MRTGKIQRICDNDPINMMGLNPHVHVPRYINKQTYSMCYHLIRIIDRNPHYMEFPL